MQGTFNDYDEIKEGMRLHSKSENYYGTVEKINGVLHTDCMGFGMEPISELDLDDIMLVE
ncbi:MAG: hypothetical protein ACYSSO_07370 [Planctomycetota bacterium]|jgi:hypothetical protein